MSDVEITINDREFKRIIRELSGGHLDDWLMGVAENINADIVASFGTSPDGLTSPSGHVASQAGFPPNVDTGTLRASMRAVDVGTLHKEIRDGVEYGRYLEEGSEHIGARPFVAPVFLVWRTRIFGVAEDGIIP